MRLKFAPLARLKFVTHADVVLELVPGRHVRRVAAVAGYNLANGLKAQGRLDDSTACRPSSSRPSRTYLGMALAGSGDRDAARQALEIARRHPATRARAEMELGRLGTK